MCGVFFVIHWRLMHGICVQKPFTGNSHWISSPIDPFFHSVGSRDLSLGVREFDPSSNTGRVMVPSYSTLQLLFIDGVKCLYRAYHYFGLGDLNSDSGVWKGCWMIQKVSARFLCRRRFLSWSFPLRSFLLFFLR